MERFGGSNGGSAELRDKEEGTDASPFLEEVSERRLERLTLLLLLGMEAGIVIGGSGPSPALGAPPACLLGPIPSSENDSVSLRSR